ASRTTQWHSRRGRSLMRAMPRPLPRRRAPLAPLRLLAIAALTLGGVPSAHAQKSTPAAKPKPAATPSAEPDAAEAQTAQSEQDQTSLEQEARKTGPDESHEEERSDDKEDKQAIYMGFNLGFNRVDVG